MKRKPLVLSALLIWYSGIIMAWPVLARADQGVPAAPAPPVNNQSLLITELQTGSTNSAAEEFVELYNPSDKMVNLTGWQIQFANSAATNWTIPHRTVPLTGTIDPGKYYVVASKYTAGNTTTTYLASIATAWYSGGIAAAAGHVRLLHTTNQQQADGQCLPQLTVADELEWSVNGSDGKPFKPSIDGRTVYSLPDPGGLAPGSSLQRYRTVGGLYADTDNDAADFGVGAISPRGDNVVSSLAITPSSAAPQVHDNCVVAAPVAADEPPAAEIPSVSENPASAAAATALPAADQNLLPPQLSELLPNPASPATDANDEFIEVYNPNNVPFDLTGFVLQTGLTTKHTYNFPVGAALPPSGFVSFTSKDTKLVLSNSGSQAVLLDPFGTVIGQSEPYGNAAAGQSWVFADNLWQWTTAPTPGEANALQAPLPPEPPKPREAKADATAETKKAPVAKKQPQVKAAKTTTKPAKQTAKVAPPEPVKTETLAASQQAPASPLHPGVLAAAAILALLYGAYEYRHDVANKINQFRTNRAARRTAGQSLKGR